MTAFATDAARWNAVKYRDPAADGAFWYSVRTTGVYCRPNCAARLARRENVAFHATQESARRAGFRPCKRCRPDQASQTERNAAIAARACKTIETAEEMPNLDELAAAAGMSRFHFHRVFKEATGVTPKAYGAAHRANRVRDALAGHSSVTEAIYDGGFASAGRFYAVARGRLGMTPTAFKQGGVGAEIRFALGQCSLGAILVAATAHGICAIALGDDPDALLRELQDRFPKAKLIGADAAFEQLVAKAVGFVDARRPALGLPLHVRGTAFQQRVWRALRDIPRGETTTYSEIAAKLGVPKSVRAVAQAIAANPVAVAIPCHRVVRRDGDLAGYRWGVERKRALLAREAQVQPRKLA